MASYGKKPGFFSKLKGTLKKAFIGTVAAGALVGAPGYYNYGTTQTQVVTTTAVTANSEWNQKESRFEYTYSIDTDKGYFRNESSLPHLKSDGDTEKLYREMNSGRTYVLKSYGFRALGATPNILEAREMTKAEIEKYQKQMSDKDGVPLSQQKQNLPQPAAPVGQGVVVAPPVSGILSGRVTTLDVLSADGSNTVQLTMPVEAAGKVTVNSITPLRPSAPPAGPKL